jgi:hypothetical protein
VTVAAMIRERAEAARDEAARLTKIEELVNELGDDGLAHLLALVGSDGSHNGNGKNGDASGEPRAPRGREAVRRIVQERPGVWTLADLRAVMEQRGWFTSAKGLEVAVKRLCDSNGEGRRIGRGRYVFPANHGEEVANERDSGAMTPQPFSFE